MKRMIFIVAPHFGQSNGSTSTEKQQPAEHEK
jgi:hypothetical protein